MRKLFISIGIGVAVWTLIGLLLPAGVRVEVATVIDAPAATVYAQINDFERMRIWSPRLRKDPNARVVLAGPDRGVGATLSWDGTIIGNGRQSIVSSKPFEQIMIDIESGAAGAAVSEFALAATGTGTEVRWRYQSDDGLNLLRRYLSALFLHRARREEHAAGLALLRELAEALPADDFASLAIEQLIVEPQAIAYLPATAHPDAAAISTAMGQAYFQILNFMDRHGLEEAGAPLSITRAFTGSQLQFDAAIPVHDPSDTDIPDSGPVRIGATYAGLVLRVRHVGPYRNLAQTHRKISAYLAAHGIDRAGSAWEAYISDPGLVREEALITDIYTPVRPR